jgi:hypothetical protein
MMDGQAIKVFWPFAWLVLRLEKSSFDRRSKSLECVETAMVKCGGKMRLAKGDTTKVERQRLRPSP